MIWNQRWQNGWLWAELLLVSVVLWFFVDYLYVTGRTRMEPLGFDVEHVYKISFGNLDDAAPGYLPPESRGEGKTDGALMVELLERMRAYPGVEAVCFSDFGLPYVSGSRYMNWQLDTLRFHSRYVRVSPDYFEVFRTTDEAGSSGSLSKVLREAGENGMIATSDVGKDSPDFHLALGQQLTNVYWKDTYLRLIGICRPIRRCEYDPVRPLLFIPFTESKLAKDYDGEMGTIEVCIRVRPEADRADFARQFRSELAKQVRGGNFYLLDVTPLSEIRASYLRAQGVENEVKTRMAISLFLLVNIFLGIIGTFWFRTEYRKGEMGLRMALGSTRRQLNSILVGEGVLLLVLAFIPSLTISINIAHMDLIDTYLLPFTWLRFAICGGITFALIALMIICGVWYPARSTARLEPAEALRYE